MAQATIIEGDEHCGAAGAASESAWMYRLVAENSCDMIVCYDGKLARRYVSPASKTILGYRPDELMGRTPLADIHPDDRAIIIEAAATVRAGTTPPVLSYRQKRKDGTYVWLEASYSLVADPWTGGPRHLVASVRDVTRRKQAEIAAAEAIARANESLRLLTMAETIAQVGHWRIDTGKNRFFWSPEVFHIYGLEIGEPPRIRRALAAYHLDDQPMIEALMKRATEEGGDFEFAARLYRTDGELRHVVSRGQAEVGADGGVVAVFGVLQDVTRQAHAEAALREGEARYRLLADNATDIIFRLARDGRFLYVSPATRAVTGYRPEDRVGQDSFALVHRDDLPALQRAVDDLWSGRETQGVANYRALCADGEWRWLEVHARLAVNEGVPEIVGVARDITARKRFEAELLSAREAAERAAREARHLAETDELTGLASRRMFMRQLDLAIALARREARPLSLAIFDVDHFKRVNDRLGHGVGDVVLARLATVVTAAAVPETLIGRLGGEEFALLMLDADAPRASELAERLRMAVEADADASAALPAMTISIGVAALSAGMAASALLAAADTALYEAKRTGRNRTCVAA